MSLKKPPAFQFYPSDYLSSARVQVMSLAAQGAYLRLLCYQWQDGFIPDDIQKLAALCGSRVPQMNTLWLQIKTCFELEIEPGKLANKRMESVRNEQFEYRKLQAGHGSRGGRPQKGSLSKAIRVEKALSFPSSSPSPSGEKGKGISASPLGDSGSPVAGPKYPADFEEFWEQSTKRGSKFAAGKAWQKLRPDEILRRTVLDAMAKWRLAEQWQDETKQPHIATWLNRRGWEEIVPASKNGNGNGSHKWTEEEARAAHARLKAQGGIRYDY